MLPLLKCIKDGTAHSIVTALEEEFDVRYSKLPGHGPDRASVMTGTQKGINVLLKMQNPFCIDSIYVCHRLTLVLSNCQEDALCLKSLSKIIYYIYNYVQYPQVGEIR